MEYGVVLRWIRYGLAVCLLPLSTTVWGQSAGAVATVNGVSIAVAEFERRVQEHMRDSKISITAIRNPSAYKRIEREVLDRLIEEELLVQEAGRHNVVASDEQVEAAMTTVRKRFPSVEKFQLRLEMNGWSEEEYRQRVKRDVTMRLLAEQVLLTGVAVTDSEVHDYYVGNSRAMRRPVEVRARHILVKLPIDARADEYAAARKRIEAILDRVRAGADFAELAKTDSEDSTADAGGDLGFFGPDKMVEPFEKAAFALQPGQISEVVRTPFGFHIIKVEERRGGEQIPEAEIREALRAYLLGIKRQQVVHEEIYRLRNAAQIEIFWAL